MAVMARIAIDVVLLPSRAMMEKAIEANRRLRKPSGGEIVLNEESCLPHISLAMGCIEEKDIEELEKILQTIAGQYSPGQLKVIDVHIGTNSVGEKVSAFQIERTKAIQSLHEEVLQRLMPYLSPDVTADMVLGPTVCESTLRWIRDYPEKSSFTRFFPHITIGYGELSHFSFPAEFTASRLALCHLGNHCTCRKVLASFALPGAAPPGF
jgi:hypothetical protein